MAAFATTLLLVVHGLIHFLGVTRAPAAERGLSQLWFFAGTLFIGAGALCALRSEWPVVALFGVLLSQLLIVTRWSEAKPGTVANVAIFVLALVAAATARLHGRADAETRELVASTGADERVVSAADLAALPEPVQRWLRRAGVVGRPRPITVRLTQTGVLHTSQEGAWMPVTAEEEIGAEPGYVWWMEGWMTRVLPLAGRDSLVAGHGATDITIAGLVPVASDRGPKVDESALVRWLAEIMWVPSAALGPAVHWEPLDEAHARATVTSRGRTASATFEIDPEGRVTSVSARRWYPPTARFERWGGRVTEWRRFAGVELPVAGEVTWSFATEDFTFFRWRIVDACIGHSIAT